MIWRGKLLEVAIGEPKCYGEQGYWKGLLDCKIMYPARRTKMLGS